MTYRGRVQNGVVVLDEPVRLPEGAEVRVEVLGVAVSDAESEEPTLYEQLEPIIGAAEDLPPDASVNLDHYLYGHPKR